MNTYEAMFLFDTTFGSDFSKVEQEVGRVMERAGAEIVMCRKWDERKLAYEIKGQKRGCYVLTFFRAEPSKIAGIERDAQLSEPVLRVLILRADHMTAEDMEAAYPSRPAAAERGAAEAREAPAQKAPEKVAKAAELEPPTAMDTGVPSEAPAGQAAQEVTPAAEAPDAAPETTAATDPAEADRPDKTDRNPDP